MRPAIDSRGEHLAMAWSESVTDGGDGDCGCSEVIVLMRAARFTAGA
jgi:hypothetical protein